MQLLASVLALLAVLPASVRAAEEGAKPVVTYRQERLSVQAKDASLPDVLQAIARATGAEVHGEPAASAPVSMRLEDVPVKDALARLLGEQSFTLTYADDGRLKTVDLRGGPTAAAAPKAPPAPGASWPPSEEARLAAAKVDDWTKSDQRYPVSGRLAQKLGSEATFSQIAEAAVTADDQRVRSQALRTGLRLLESEGGVRDAFVQTLDSVDDAFLVNYCQFFMKDRADEFVAAMARHARTPALRTRAQSVRQALRTTPAPNAG